MVETLKRRATAVLDHWRPISIGLLAVLAINLFVHFVLIRDLVRTSGDRGAIVSSRRDKVRQVESVVDGLERATSKLACTRSDVRHLFDEVLSSKEDRLTAILREVRQLAAASNMDPQRIAYSASPLGETDLVQFGISFPLEAPYETLRQFIRQVEASPNFLVIEDVSLVGSRAQGTSLKLNVRMKTFFKAPDLQALLAAFPAMETTP